MQPNFLLQIIILIFSVIIHEVSHGTMALIFGDKTAEYEGRLTLNPVSHIDPVGSIFLPLFLWIVGSPFMIGWAKPVPYNPYNLQNRKIAEPLVALAGPLSNIVVSLIFGTAIRFLVPAGLLNPNLLSAFVLVVFINISLAIFNLLPVPPLDGSKILFTFLPIKSRFVFSEIAARYGFIIIVAIMYFLPNIISPVIYSIFSLFTGLN